MSSFVGEQYSERLYLVHIHLCASHASQVQYWTLPAGAFTVLRNTGYISTVLYMSIRCTLHLVQAAASDNQGLRVCPIRFLGLLHYVEFKVFQYTVCS